MAINVQLKRHAIPLLLLLSVLAFVINHFLPPKRLVFYPHAFNQNHIYGYIDPQTGQSSRWINQDKHEWECTFKPEHPWGCGSNISWGQAADAGIDLSEFDTLEFKMEYEGTSTRLRVALQNFNDAYSDINEPGSAKHMSLLINPEQIRGNTLRVDLSDFNVSKWWVKDRRIHRRWASQELDNIVLIGIEVVEPGENRVKIESISAIGPWLESQTFLYIVVFGWMAFFLSQGLMQFYQVYINSQQDRQQIRELLKKQEDLEVEKQYLSDIAKIDPLTEVYNRNGFLSRLEELAPNKRSPNNNLAILVLDLDHFKSINDNYGHDFGDAALKVFANAIKQSIRDQDIFARWGGEEFILLCKVPDKTALRGFAEKLRKIIESSRVDSNLKVAFTVSIGVAWFQMGDYFDEVLKRADVALYQAKQEGRNRVVYDL